MRRGAPPMDKCGNSRTVAVFMEVTLEALTFYDKLKLGDMGLREYQMLMGVPNDKLKLGDTGLREYQKLVQHIARDNSELSLARRKDATCYLRWIMSVMPDTTVQTCHQRAIGSKTMERRVATVILNVYQSTGIAKGDGSTRL